MLELAPSIVIALLVVLLAGHRLALRPRRSAPAREPAAGSSGTDEGLCLTQGARPTPEARADPRALARLSHELRTPLNGVLGFAELLLAGDMEEPHRAQVQLISESGRTMMRLLNDILDLNRLERGDIRLVLEAADLREDIAFCTRLMEPPASDRGISLRTTVPPDLPEMLTLDHLRLRDILLNLMGNALKRRGVSMIEVNVSLSGETLRIGVSDNGPAIARAERDNIFEPFYDCDDAETARGLGLAIALQTVRRMGGDIVLESTPGAGITFTVNLPIIVTQGIPGKPTDRPVPDDDLSGTRLLVVEDNPINQQLILAMLEKLGIQTVLVGDGMQAIAAVDMARCEGEGFDLVLMDLQMPGLDGLETTRLIRQSGIEASELPILALTANCFADDIVACRDAGMQGHIAKPVQLADLSAQIAANRKTASAIEHPVLLQTRQAADLDIRTVDAKLGSSTPGLEDKFSARKAELFRMIRRQLCEEPEEVDWDSLLRELHKLAGSAANFGEAELGDLSRRTSREIRQTQNPRARQLRLSRAYAEMCKTG